MVLSALALAACTTGTSNAPSTLASPNTQTTGINVINQPTGISVDGQGKATATPDLAVARLGFAVKTKTVAEAQSQAASSMQAVIAALKAKGLGDKDIQTSRFSIVSEPQMENGRQVGTLFHLTNVVTAKIRQMDKVGDILDAALASGANRVESLSFTIEDPTPIMNQARDKAMADAKAKADQLAKGTGVKVGSPISISEGGIALPLQTMQFAATAAARGAADSTPINPG